MTSYELSMYHKGPVTYVLINTDLDLTHQCVMDLKGIPTLVHKTTEDSGNIYVSKKCFEGEYSFIACEMSSSELIHEVEGANIITLDVDENYYERHQVMSEIKGCILDFSVKDVVTLSKLGSSVKDVARLSEFGVSYIEEVLEMLKWRLKKPDYIFYLKMSLFNILHIIDSNQQDDILHTIKLFDELLCEFANNRKPQNINYDIQRCEELIISILH